MPPQTTTRYCADPQALGALKRDSLGWGHDLECGCFRDLAPVRKGPLARIFTSFIRRG
ncbi:hypothetical protein [Yoonia sp.]|uniref:hypothetical protein n=1 Tax=Yoonia sp. TaxID=2212373 RepID=UPI002FD92559